MTTTFEQITRDAMTLAPKQRAELADCLVESLDSLSTDDVQQAWLDEANRRLVEVRKGEVETIPGEDVLAEARRLVKR